MKKIGITGSLASGKTTASKILSLNRGPLFSADDYIKKLYQKKNFRNIVCKKLDIKKKSNLKKNLRHKIITNKNVLRKLEKLIHPLVRREMRKFSLKHKKKKIVFYEIPLLIENKLMKNFNTIIFIKAKKNTRLKRFKLKGGNTKFFNILNSKQLNDVKKTKFCDHVVVNEKNIKILKNKLLDIIEQYE